MQRNPLVHALDLHSAVKNAINNDDKTQAMLIKQLEEAVKALTEEQRRAYEGKTNSPSQSTQANKSRAYGCMI